MSKVINLTGSLSTYVNSKQTQLVVVDFFAEWCGPCKRIHPVFEEMSRNYPKAIFIRVDSDKNPEAQNYGIKGLPTFVFFLNGKEVERFSGADANQLERLIVQYIAKTNKFTGAVLSLGGSSDGNLSADAIREMRQRALESKQMSESNTANTAQALQKDSADDSKIVEDLLNMGFEESTVLAVLSQTSVRDMATLVDLISEYDESSMHGHSEPTVVCDGDTCRLVPPKSSVPMKSLDERKADVQRKLKEINEKRDQESKTKEFSSERERIEYSKKLMTTREEAEAMKRKHDAEAKAREVQREKDELKRQLELWNKDHGIVKADVQAKVVKEKTPLEKAKLLVESVYIQKIDDMGFKCLQTVRTLLLNSLKGEEKYRKVRLDNNLFKSRIACVPGGTFILEQAGFVKDEEFYIIDAPNEEHIQSIVGIINNFIN